MNKPLVSIVMPNRNGERYLRQAVESALQQSYPVVEVIVVDDGSADGSDAILDCFGDAICRTQTRGSGAPAARNAGLRLAHGEFIKFLDSDDVLLPDCLARQVDLAQQLPPMQKAIVYGDALWVDEAGAHLPGYPHRPRREEEDAVAHMLRQSPLISCPLHKRAYLEEVGGFDVQITKGQEHDLHVRLVLHGVEFVHFAGPLFHYRQHGDAARISNRAVVQGDPMQHFKLMQRQLATMRQVRGAALSPEVNIIVAQRFWAYGRAILREGHGEAAWQYFAMARQLDAQHCIAGKAPYPVLARLIGPLRAERVMTALRKPVQRNK